MRRSVRVMAPLITSLVVLLGSTLPAEAALPLERKRCGARISHSFRLRNNLTCDADGLRIRAHGITIDLNGKTIKGDGEDGDYGIDNSSGFDRLTIMTGRGRPLSLIKKFYNGVQVGPRASHLTIRRIGVLESAHDGIHLDGGNGHRILKSQVGGSGDEGIELIGDGGVVRDSKALLNDGVGIQVEGNGNDITLSDTGGNVGAGATIAGDLNTFELNNAKHNVAPGIHVLSGIRNEVRFNAVCDNETGKQIVDEGDQTIIEDNTVTDGACP